MGKKLTKVAITDDHNMVVDAFKTTINQMSAFKVTLTAMHGKDLLKKLAAAKEKPDIILLDLGMPVMDGYTTMPILKKEYPSIPVLVVSMFELEFSVLKLIGMGAHGYLLKGQSTDDMHDALLTVSQGNYYMPNEIKKTMMARLKGGKPLTDITARELEFLSYCCTEMKYKEIADRMNVSTRTVESHRDSLFHKLDVSSRSGLILFALNAGIRKPEQ